METSRPRTSYGFPKATSWYCKSCRLLRKMYLIDGHGHGCTLTRMSLSRNDFGLARLNSKISRSAQDPKLLARTETYRAPEFDLPNSKISRVSDVFSLGCAFLEFTTWFVEGYKAAHQQFVDARMEVDPNWPEFEVDTFFRIEDVRGKKVPTLKPQVTEWIQRLRNHPRCTQFVVDFLDVIEKDMLNPDPKKRSESYKVEKRLRTIRDTCRADTEYRKEPKPPR